MADSRPLREDEPKWVGSYRLTGYLGWGSQGSVYRGMSPSGQTVVVKVLHHWPLGGDAARQRFAQEMSLARRVVDSRVARVLDVGFDVQLPYLVSEYVPGESLHAVVERHGPQDIDAITRLASGTAAALAAIHRAGVVHGDLKPRNVLLGGDGPRVVDFGLARATGASVTGSPVYAAVEQLVGQDSVPASDVFSWAGTMVFAATGRPAFGDDDVPAVLWRIANAEPDLSGVPEQIVPLLSACLDKNPARRPSADQLVSALLGRDASPRIVAGPTLVGAPPVPVPVQPIAAGQVSGWPAGDVAAGAAERPAFGPMPSLGNGDVAAGATDRPALGPMPDLGKPVPGEEEWIRRPRRRAAPLGIAASGAALAVAAALVFVLWPSGPKVDTAQRTRAVLGSGHARDVPAAGAPLGRPLSLGSGPVSAIAESTLRGTPVLVTGGQDGDLRVFDRSTGRQVGAPLTGHQGKVTALAAGVLNAKPVVVSGGVDRTIRVWDLAAGHETGTPFTGDTGAITALATAIVGGRSMVLSGSADFSVRRWDMATGQQIGPPILGHQSPVTSVTTTTLNGKPVVVAGCAAMMVRAWYIASGVQVGVGFMGHTAALTSLAAATLNGRPVVVSGGADRSIKVSDLATGRVDSPAFPRRPSTVAAVATTEVKGRAAVLAAEGRTVRVWDLATRRQILPPLTGSTSPVIWVTTDTVGGVPAAVAGAADGTVRMWRLR